MLQAAIEHVCAGERLHLLPERALWWPAARALIVADVHIGKAAAFRAGGQPVPAGTTAGNLRRLDALLQATAARQLLVLGDFLHARAGVTPGILQALHAWRARHRRLHCVLVRGNHDSRAGDPPESLNVQVLDEPHLAGPFALRHHPQPHATHCVLAGHLHPALVLRGGAREQLRLPCFDFGPRIGILPAFGGFTGHATLAADPAHRHFVVADGRVWPVPAGARAP